MSDGSQQSVSLPTTAEEIAELLTEFEQYRKRLVDETIAVAKKAKMPKSAVMAQLEPELAKIDAMVENLKQQQAGLASGAE
jgi:hypothetical protein